MPSRSVNREEKNHSESLIGFRKLHPLLDRRFNTALLGMQWTLFWVAVCCVTRRSLRLTEFRGAPTQMAPVLRCPEKSVFMKGSPCQERACHLAPSCQRTDCGITIRIQECGTAGSKCRAGKHMSPAWYFSFTRSRKVEISQRCSSNCSLLCLPVWPRCAICLRVPSKGGIVFFGRLRTLPQRAQEQWCETGQQGCASFYFPACLGERLQLW